MAGKFPIQYQINPTSTPAGRSWLDVSLKNISQDPLTGLDVRLNSLDTYAIEVLGDAEYVSSLAADEEVQLNYRVAARRSGGVYVSVDGRWDGEPFHWESPARRIAVGHQVAELVSVFVLSDPHPRRGEPIHVEATLRGLTTAGGLILEFWVETPSGESISVDKTATDPLSPGEVVTYRPDPFVPEEEGIYVIHAYLFDGTDRIGHATDYLSITT
ncbi:MAG: hypothetical protein U9R72_06590 [Chloroflexota bacterium]|nr:hypothetical protein [Chloroflexota bacterium]